MCIVQCGRMHVVYMDMDVHLYEAYMNCAWKCMWRYGFVNCVGDYQCV